MDMNAAEVVAFKNVDKKHKIKPMQFISVASGVQKRLETNVKHRKSCRLTKFDNVRDLSRNTNPVKEDEAERKYKQGRQQLEKWKQEREKKKKEQAAHKKKPFLAGVVPVPLSFVPPLPMPSTSGRVTRVQAARVTTKQEKPRSQLARVAINQENPKQSASFAMLHASILSKNIDIEGIGLLEQTPNLPSMDATPAQSILKSSNKERLSMKAIKTVLYQSDDEPAKESEAHLDSNLSSVDAEQEPDKENIRAKLVRQNAVHLISPLKTRSARKSMNTPKEDTPKSPKRSTKRKKALQESEGNVLETDEEVEVRKRRDTPRRSCRSKADDKINL